MASSKKYGYQLRGDKLSLVELDITGSGNGLNYTYEQNAGLDISTDPSSWKSPLTSIDDGLQVEYLSNDLDLQDEFIEIPVNTLHSSNTSMSSDGITHWKSWNDTTGLNEDLANYGLSYSPTTNASFSSVTGIQLNGLSGDLLKISKYWDSTSDNDYLSQREWIHTGSFPLELGHRYRMSIDINIDYVSHATYTQSLLNSSFHIDEMIYVLVSGDDLFTEFPTSASKNLENYALSPQAIDAKNLVNLKSSPDSSMFAIENIGFNNVSPLNTGWKTISFDFVAISNNIRLAFQIPLMNDETHSVHLDNFMISKFDTPLQTRTEKEILMPSYAQKALLDYVRAQEAYENGELEKWGFFMKQFRSKLERWEDSRITGPRVLGPHGPSSIT